VFKKLKISRENEMWYYQKGQIIRALTVGTTSWNPGTGRLLITFSACKHEKSKLTKAARFY
jgi:hypothetical protein